MSDHTPAPLDVEAMDVRRMRRPDRVPPVPGETTREAEERRRANRQAAADWDFMVYAKCAKCGMARINVVHEQDPDTSIEGPTYYSDFLVLDQVLAALSKEERP